MRTYVPVIAALTAAMLPIEPVSGLAADNAQSAIEELVARPSGGGGDPGPVAAAAVSVDPIEGLAATDAQTALAELAARPSGGAELPNASTVPVRPAKIEFTVPDGIAPPTFGFYLQLGQITYPNGSDGFETYARVFERVSSHGHSDENGNVVSIVVDGLDVTIALAGPLRMTGPAAEQFGIPDQVFLPKPEVAADTVSDHVRVGDETLTEALDRLGSLPNASTVPGAPSTVTITIPPGPPAMDWDSVEFQIGNAFHPPVNAYPGEPWTDFFVRIGGMNLTDENGENPLIVEVAGTAITFRSGARLRSGSGIFFVTLGAPLDVSPSSPRSFDTSTASVRHGNEALAAVVARLLARPPVADPSSVIRGVRSHDALPTLVANGAVAGDQLNFSYSPATGPARQDSLVISETTTLSDVSIWLHGSPALNPAGPGTEIEAGIDALRAFIAWSKSGYPISLFSSGGDGSGARALLGSLPT